MNCCLINCEVSRVVHTIYTVDSDGVITGGKVRVGSGFTCNMVLTIYIIIWCASCVHALEVDSACAAEVNRELT